MDLGFVAAAAAAGYLAKYWKNLSRGENGSPELASDIPNIVKPESPSCPFSRFRQRKRLEKDVPIDMGKGLDPGYSDKHQLECASTAEVDCTDWDVLLTLNSVPVLMENDNLIANWEGCRPSDDIGRNYGNISMEELDFLHGSLRKKGNLRAKYFPGHFVKPLNSTESCLLAQLQVEGANVEEYVLSAPPPPCRPTMRPFLVTNGSKIISRARGGFSSSQIRIDDDRQFKEGNVSGVPQLPSVGYLDHPMKLKLKREQWHSGRLSSSSKLHSGKRFQSQDGPRNGTFLFYLGISIGIIFSFMKNTREVNKLKELLMQTENLVQDLQDELDMKESLTVKELGNETSESQDADHTSHNIAKPFFSEHGKNNLSSNGGKDSNNEKAVESSESMSKIEAELEAELERLGLKINTSIYEGRLPDLDELDPHFAADFAKGELKVDMVNGQTAAHPKSDQDKSGNSAHHFQNFVVSPRELSLRLHEVIQSRLEERVKELETAVQNSLMKMQHVKLEYRNSWRKLACHELMYSSMPGSPIAREESSSMPEPLVMNLSGEALDPYNEAYEELTKTNHSEEENSPSGIHRNSHQVGLQIISWGKNGKVNGSRRTPSTEETSKELRFSQIKTPPEHYSRVQELLDVGIRADENTNSDDEMDQRLIKQIVEQTKKGSPLVLNAQKALFLMDEIEH